MPTEQPTPIWAIMPVLKNLDLTVAALSDLLAQTIPTRILVIVQGANPEIRSKLEQIAEQEPRVLVWSHNPPLPSLSATWNRALQFVWECGGEEALVVNNDVRLHPITAGVLRLNMRERSDGLFVTGVGVTKEQFDRWRTEGDDPFLIETTSGIPANSKGGPDFSCFLISRVGHEKYPFDEAFTPAFCEDLDCHRRYMLGGDGDRIFSINLPYLHVGGGSASLKAMDAESRRAHEEKISRGSRAHYERKWGGPVNHERFTIPFDAATDQDGVTTPELQRMIQAAARVETIVADLAEEAERWTDGEGRSLAAHADVGETAHHLCEEARIQAAGEAGAGEG